MSEGFIVNHRGEEVEAKAPRVVALQIRDEQKHFHKINYKKDLKITLQKTLTFDEPGLMTKAEYFEDKDKTIPVLTVEREYKIEPILGKLLEKRTKRTYYCEDGSIHPDIKDPGWYEYTPGESRDATHRRRTNITNNLEDEMLELLGQLGGSSEEEKAASVAGGAAFMAELTNPLTVFHVSGTIQAIIDFVNDPAILAKYEFLLADIPGKGIKAKDLIVLRLTY